ncbi:MAG: prolipoprotein diacylglyceryl transferase [Bacteroidetes bacterium]|nr:prolipoprotein diacylglyceryl transferase [Bacteroidota bacterium]
MYWLWNPNPVAFVVGDFVVGWYGILFALGFLLAQRLVIFMYREEGKPGRDLDALLIYLIIGTVVGARLGHCLFYDPQFYMRNPIAILKIWEGGLASHGATAGLLAACFIFSRRKRNQPFLWLVDRIAIVAALVGALVRVGNFINAEIIGTPTGARYGVVFLSPLHDVIRGSGVPALSMEAHQAGSPGSLLPGTVPVRIEVLFPPEAVQTAQSRLLLYNTMHSAWKASPIARPHVSDLEFADPPRIQSGDAAGVTLFALAVARHPVQLYEAAVCLALAIYLFLIWRQHGSRLPHGALLGRLCIILFGSRFLLEFFKESVTPIETGWPISMGQLLSIPFVGLGIWLLLTRKNTPSPPSP